MAKALPVILCGKTEQVASTVIPTLRPEIEGASSRALTTATIFLNSFVLTHHPPFPVVHFIMSPSSGAAQIPRLLKGEKSVPADSDLGSKDYSRTPIAVLLGGAFDDAVTAQMMKATAAVEGAKRVPWLRPDMTKPHPPLGPEYGPAMALRIKERLGQLMERGEMDEEKVMWY